MKTRLIILLLAFVACSCQAASSIRIAYFYPKENRIVLYVSDDGFARSAPVSMSSLEPAKQAEVEQALSWLVSRLPSGMQDLSQVILTKLPDQVTSWSQPGEGGTPPIPIAWSPAFSAAVTGTGEKGEASVEVFSVPGSDTNNMAELWASLEGGL